MIKKIRLEVPVYWFSLKSLHTNILMTNLITEITSHGIPVYFSEIKTDTYEVPRSPEKGELVFSYHSHGKERNVWRIKETPLPFVYSFEEDGYSGWSSISQNFEKYISKISAISTEESEKIISDVLKDFYLKGESKYCQPELKELDIPEPYVFFPLQVIHDPVSDFSRFSMIEILTNASNFAKKIK